MNPVLIKPEADSRSQVIVMGRPWQTLEAKNYYEKKKILWGHVTQSLDRLREAHELVIIEGAGSPMELNIKRGDIVNMAVAKYAKAPVLLVGDIERGGPHGWKSLRETANRLVSRMEAFHPMERSGVVIFMACSQTTHFVTPGLPAWAGAVRSHPKSPASKSRSKTLRTLSKTP
jgi:hypothetical protein